jgi:Putative Tad-like Flp pilus-assembly
MHGLHGSAIRGLLRDEGGNIAMLVAIMLGALFAFSALAVDGGNLYVLKSKLQRTADSAALAAASQLPDENDARAEALEYALKNMPVAEHGSTLVDGDIDLGYWHPGTRSFVSGGEPVNAVMVTTRRSAVNNNPAATYFAGLMGYDEVDVETTSVAGRVSAVCILALDPSSESAFLVNNGTVIAEGCAVQVNSDDPQALDVTSNGTMETLETCVHGGSRILGSATPPPTTGCPPVSDPLAGLEEPTVGGCDHTNIVLSAPNTFNLTEGVYCGGLEIKGQAEVFMAPGLYIMKNGPFTITGQANVTGNGVTIFLTGNDAVADTGGSGAIELSAPTTGDLAGILFFEGRDNTPLQEHAFRGGSNKSYSGVIYTPVGVAEYVGNGAGSGSGTPWFIAWQFRMSGNGELHIQYDPTSGFPLPEVMNQKLAILQ